MSDIYGGVLRQLQRHANILSLHLRVLASPHLLSTDTYALFCAHLRICWVLLPSCHMHIISFIRLKSSALVIHYSPTHTYTSGLHPSFLTTPAFVLTSNSTHRLLPSLPLLPLLTSIGPGFKTVHPQYLTTNAGASLSASTKQLGSGYKPRLCA